jgi:hypothetical protein
MARLEALTTQYVDEPGEAVYGDSQLPGAAHVEDFRPGAVFQTYHKGQPSQSPYTVTSYPYTKGEVGPESVWVDVTRDHPPSVAFPEGFTSEDSVSLQDHSVAPVEGGKYSRWNVDKLVTPAPVTDPTVPKSLRKLLEQPYDHLTNKEKAKATRYFLGKQATSFLERKSRGVEEPLLDHSSIEV